MNEDIQSESTCLSFYTKFKRFKQDEYSKVDHNAPAVKSTKLKSCKNTNKRYISTCRCLKKSSDCNYKVNRNAFYINLYKNVRTH